MDTLDKRVLLLARIPREIYEVDRDSGKALELVLTLNGEGLTSNYFNYDWAGRKRESEEPRLKGKFLLTDEQVTPLNGIYQNLAEALAKQGYFVEEKDKSTILLQPLATSVECINGLVDNFIERLKEVKSPLLQRPRLGNSEHAYRIWLEGYHAENGMPLPPHFYNLDKKGLEGMFYGITDPKRMEQRLRERQFVAEFYKAHNAALPNDFGKWGHKQVEVLYRKLNSWYAKGVQPQKIDAPQLPLFSP